MAEPFKNFLNAGLVREAASHLARHTPGFDAKAFVRQASTGLDALELKARSLHICAALEATMPAAFDAAAKAFEAALAPPTPEVASEGGDAPAGLNEGLRGWILWPVGEYIARHGQAQPERALAALHGAQAVDDAWRLAVAFDPCVAFTIIPPTTEASRHA